MNLLTNPQSWQEEAIAKFSNVSIGALFMEAGTGKTRTMLGIMALKLERGLIDKVLWLCPATVQKTIVNEAIKHCSDHSWLKIMSIEGMSSSVAMVEEAETFLNANRCLIVVDEASKIKNHVSKRSVKIEQFTNLAKYRFILTATPLTKQVADLYSPLAFLSKEILGYSSFNKFEANHLEIGNNGQYIKSHNVEWLKAKIKPYSYTCTIDEVLPPKVYHQCFVQMNSKQRQLYDITKEKFLDEIKKDIGIGGTKIREMFTNLCKITAGYTKDKEGKIVDLVEDDNPRLKALYSILDANKGQKVAIYCHYIFDVQMLKMNLSDRGKIAQYTGSRKDDLLGDWDILLITIGTGSFGLNELIGVQHTVYYSNTFDWEARHQSEKRTHRLGITASPHYYDIICEDSIDTWIAGNLKGKANLVALFKKELKDGTVSL